MGANCYTKVVYGKMVEHQTKQGDPCCVEAHAKVGGSFCNTCGKSLDEVKEVHMEERFPEFEAGIYSLDSYGGAGKYIVGKGLHNLEYQDGPQEVRELSTEEEDKVKAILGDDCKYLVWQDVSY